MLIISTPVQKVPHVRSDHIQLLIDSPAMHLSIIVVVEMQTTNIIVGVCKANCKQK